MRAARLAAVFGCLLAVGAGSAGCGGGSGSGDSTAAAPPPAESRPAPLKSRFPSPEGRTLKTLLKDAASPSELIVSSAAMVFNEGENRYPFGVFEHDGAQVSDAEVALYLARVPTPPKGRKSKSGGEGEAAKSQTQALEQPAVGPFPASIESLTAKPASQIKATAEASITASVVYSTRLDFPSGGEWRIAALIKEGDHFGAKLLPGAVVGEFHRVPRPGRRAPSIHTPAAGNKVDYAEALGKRPIVLLFATPKFCQSQVCGPVVDVAEEAKRKYGDKAAFIHMDIYKDSDPGKGVRPQVRAFHLPSAPWLFTIDRSGHVSSAIEGAFGPELMTGAVERVVAE